MQDQDFDDALEFAIELARRAGRMIRDASSNRNSHAADGTKKNSVDLVTETDQAVERFILSEIRSKYPDHKFIGEESYAAGEKVELTDEPTWIVDPIGTTNFVHQFDHVAVSIGFTYQQIPTIGVIYNPFLEKLYSARQGKGAFLNQHIRLPLSHPNEPLPLDSLSDAVIAVEWGSDRSKRAIDGKGDTFKKLTADGQEVKGGVMAHALRSIGSAALNYSYVASGSLDLYWEIGCCWDVCAGTIIAREAGAKVYGKAGKAFEPQDLMGHHFFVVRAIGDNNETGETGEQAQDRIAKQFFDTVVEWE
ncbi:hypothetical protein OIV83_004381 [Microbotryomycetes sp. JL201]|nr:hypothetical protein OIV83_004381 [Microbotryomycetes sp. JL201]